MNPVKILYNMKKTLPADFVINEQLSINAEDVIATYTGWGVEPPLVYRRNKWRSTAAA